MESSYKEKRSITYQNIGSLLELMKPLFEKHTTIVC